MATGRLFCVQHKTLMLSTQALLSCKKLREVLEAGLRQDARPCNGVEVYPVVHKEPQVLQSCGVVAGRLGTKRCPTKGHGVEALRKLSAAHTQVDGQ